jgi:hypothetical protein
VFSNLFQVAEYYQYWSTNTSILQNSLITNITGNGFALNGGSGVNPPFIIQSNIFYFTAAGANGIETTPADNVYILNNQFYCGSSDTAIAIGVTGYQGTCNNSNIVISGNYVTGENIFVQVGADPPNDAANVTICSNTVAGGAWAVYTYGLATNVNVYANSLGSIQFHSGIRWDGSSIGQFALVNSNNVYSDWGLGGAAGTTTVVSYGTGPRHTTKQTASGAAFVLDDSTPAQIPSGAYQLFDNSQNQFGAGYQVFLGQARTASVPVANGQIALFYWNNGAWSTNPPPASIPAAPAPPTDLHLLH